MRKNFIIGLFTGLILIGLTGAYSFIHGDKAYTGIQWFQSLVYASQIYNQSGGSLYLNDPTSYVDADGKYHGDGSALTGIDVSGKMVLAPPTTPGSIAALDVAGQAYSLEKSIFDYSTTAEVASLYYNQTQIITDFYSKVESVAKFMPIDTVLTSTLAALTDVSLASITQGDILYWAGSNWQNLHSGTSGKVLTANGTTSNPSWETATGGHTIKDNTTPLTQRANLNFTGFVVADNAGTSATDISLATTAYTTTFVNADLTAGVLTVTHNLAQKVCNVLVSNNSDKMIIPDDITFTDTNNLAVDISSFGTIAGTWTVNVIRAGGSGSGGGGTVADFTDLGDVPSSYSGQGGKYVKVNSGASALEFGTETSELPSQTGNDGKYLQTDGNAATWQAVAGASQAIYNYTQNFTVTTSFPSNSIVTNYGATSDIKGTLAGNLADGFGVTLMHQTSSFSDSTVDTSVPYVVAAYKFNTGALTTDSWGSNTLTNVNTVAESASGKSGYCADLERGSSHHFKIASPGSDLVPVTAFSFACWLQIESSLGSDERRQIFFQTTASAYVGCRLRNQGTYYVFDTYNSTNSTDNGDTTTPVAEPSLATWYHFAFTQEVSGSNMLTKVYWNGSLNKTLTTAGTSLKARTDLWIGTENGSACLWDGLMDEIYIWKDYTLSQAQVTQLAATSPSFCVGKRALSQK